VRLHDIERADIRLQSRIGIVGSRGGGHGLRCRCGCRRFELVERLHDEHAFVGFELFDHRFARGARGNAEQHTMHLELLDGPLGNGRERILARDFLQRVGGRSAHTVVSSAAVAVRRAAHRAWTAGNRIRDRDHDELPRRAAHLGRRQNGWGRRCRRATQHQRRGGERHGDAETPHVACQVRVQPALRK
jgi:hypothetical protein